MKLFIQASAEQDILRQFEWYAGQGLGDIAGRFLAATREAISGLAATPGAGVSRHVSNSHLAGLRVWSVRGFDEFRVYYLSQPEFVIVVRILHGKRDVGAILEAQKLEAPDPH